VLLETGSQEQLIFKHAISTISHARRGSGELRAPQATSGTQSEAAGEAAETPGS
jgi:Hfq protein